MKKTLIHLAVLQTAALAATAVNAHAKDRVITLKPAAENDDALYLKPIVTREMLADKRPIHIGGGCSDLGTEWPNTGTAKQSIPDRDGIQFGITKMHPIQLGQQHAAALA